MKIVISYLKLCRLDAALIAFFSYLVGAQIAGGSDRTDVLVALAVTVISTNFIYSFNSWADRELDKLSKPERPIPAGMITPKQAFIYAMVLLALSAVYPFFVFTSAFTLLLFLLLPALGLIYSAEPLRTKKNPYLAVVTICIGLVTPITLGYLMNAKDLSEAYFFAVLFVFCLSVVPLKQAEEAELDAKTGYPNLYIKHGAKILAYPLCGLFLVLLLILFLNTGPLLKIIMLVLTISVMGCVLAYACLKRKLQTLYQRIIQIVILEGVLFFVILKLV